MRSQWWKKSVVYQIYPRSFCDSNGDGIGDINGIIFKLDYIKKLGADVIWISPIYKSPMFDNGYDISDYTAINPEFGTMADFDRLLKEAHDLGLKIVMDLVVNHTSNQHPWFLESRSSKENPKRDYYIWRDGRDGRPPNNWQAWFGGSAWTLDETTGQYFLNTFSPYQPDLNWENPALRAAIYDMMRWWLDKGIDGFRMDAISLISKPKEFIDGDIRKIIPNGPRVHEFLQEMRREVLSKYDIMTVGETGGVTIDEAIKYANADGTELDMVIQFEQIELDGGETFKWNDRKINLVELKALFSQWQTRLYDRAWNSLYWSNHDQPRVVSRLGNDKKYREKSAKMIATYLHFLQGTPYVYQGEEIGMTNAPFADISDYRDLESINAYNELVEQKKLIPKEDMLRFLRNRSRDNSRTPMQWNTSANAGFSSGKPWIMVNPNYIEINVEKQMRRKDSVFAYYQNLIQLRKQLDIITFGNYELLLPDDPDLYVYTRNYQNEALLVVCNFSPKGKIFPLPQRFIGSKLLISNEKTLDFKFSAILGPFGTAVFYT
ncbi:glycoside hydrolase family 13 protein [Treponema sp. R6D11]